MQKKQEIAWSLYWADDRLHSCVAADQAEDQQVLNQLWEDFASDLPLDANALDLATGNGAVPSAMLAAHGSLSIDAIDQAEIDPVQNVKDHPELSAVNFSANRNILDLDTDKRYTAITSQFGIEYAGFQQAADVALDCLDDDGRFMFIVHHVDSEIINSSRSKIQELAALLSPDGLLETLLDVLRGSRPFTELEQRGAAYLDSEIVKTTAISGQVFAGIERSAGLLERDLPAARDIGVTLNLRVRAEHERLTQMLSAAQSETQMSEWRSHIEKSGYVCTLCEPVYVDVDKQEYLLGWQVQGRRA